MKKNIKATELRIGNTILFEGKPIIVTISTIQAVLHSEDDERCLYEPIMLTPTLLKQMGWKKERTDWEYEGYWFTKGKKWTISPTYEFYNGVYSQIIESVHKLQNLYYSLTGKELVQPQP